MIQTILAYATFCLIVNLLLFFWALRSKRDRTREIEDRRIIRERLVRVIESGPFILG